MTKSETIRKAKQVFCHVAGTEFAIRIYKCDMEALVHHLGGWERVSIDTLKAPGGFDAFVDIENV